jgi:hypothetical protein
VSKPKAGADQAEQRACTTRKPALDPRHRVLHSHHGKAQKKDRRGITYSTTALQHAGTAGLRPVVVRSGDRLPAVLYLIRWAAPRLHSTRMHVQLAAAREYTIIYYVRLKKDIQEKGNIPGRESGSRSRRRARTRRDLKQTNGGRSEGKYT